MILSAAKGSRRILRHVSLAALVCSVVCALARPAARAQQPATTPSAVQAELPPSEPIHTLHVYMNLEQIPVLVLTSERERLKKPLQESAFRISLDSGPSFKPAHVRMEGDDPLSLSLLIDLTKPRSELLDGLAEAIEQLGPEHGGTVPGALRAHDHVSVYILDCKLLRTAQDLPANGLLLEKAVDAGLDGWQARLESSGGKPACAKHVQLWDAMGFVTAQLQKLPGRRVLLVLTDGVDRGSRMKWSDEMRAAQIDAVTIFGLVKDSDLQDLTGGHAILNPVDRLQFGNDRPLENPFDNICQATGGMILGSEARTLSRDLARFLQMLRERYVVEFPRSDDMTAGFHNIAVSIEKFQGFIRPSALTSPIADRKLLDDPTTLKSDPATQVPIGTRKPM
jgi:hypothetical protein